MASWQLRPITATVHRCSRLTTRSAIPQAERDQRLVSFHLLGDADAFFVITDQYRIGVRRSRPDRVSDEAQRHLEAPVSPLTPRSG